MGGFIPMIGKTLSHYRIVEKIGAGGMGEVYRARDEHLGRDVALKVLPTGTLSDEHARKRFRKEALALSKLNHPHIATVHDFDTQDGVDFLVMELVEGVTLSDKLAAGALSEKEITRLGMQLAEALEEAHERGVVHRDLKPGNVMVTAKGQVKVLDFGLAKLVKPVTGTVTTESFTETQAAAGTLPYMAPEQVRAEKVDARTDLYALGAVLYEMATGQRAFAETQAGRLMDAILHTAPVAPTRFQPRLSGELERIILKCLEKEPENRYQSAKELGVDLRRLSLPEAVVAETRKRAGWLVPALAAGLIVAVLAVAAYFARDMIWPPPPTGKVMLAVLPFDNLSGDPEQEYFSDGLTEEMISQLGRLQPQRLGVIARTSAMHYKGTNKRLDEIGRELGVDYILEGSVRREADRVRITAQLIQVSDQTHLWAESYERELAGVFAIQIDVSRRIARSLELELLPAQRSALVRAPTTSSEAHEAYLKGRYYWNKRTEEGIKKSLDYFQEAIAREPSYAMAYSGLVDAYSIGFFYGYLPREESIPRMRAAALRAVELDDALAEAHTSLGDIHWQELDWLGAEREFQRAIELNPNYVTAYHWYSAYLSAMGRHQEAVAIARKALEVDPVSVLISLSLGRRLYFMRRYDDAIGQYRKTLELDPNYFNTYSWLARVYGQKGMYEEAISAQQKAVALSRNHRSEVAGLGYFYAVAGRSAEALKILEELKELSKQKYVSPRFFAVVYVGLGQKDEAFDWLEKSYDEHTGALIFLKVDPWYDPLRSDPRFQSLLRRMNFPE